MEGQSCIVARGVSFFETSVSFFGKVREQLQFPAILKRAARLAGTYVYMYLRTGRARTRHAWHQAAHVYVYVHVHILTIATSAAVFLSYLLEKFAICLVSMPFICSQAVFILATSAVFLPYLLEIIARLPPVSC